MECGLVLSSVTPWELIPKTKGETRGGYMCKYCKGYWRAGGRQGHLATGVGRTPGWPLQPLGEGAVGVLPQGGALGPVAGRLHCGPEGRFGQTTQTGHVSDAIWELILRNPEAAALKRIDDIAKGAA